MGAYIDHGQINFCEVQSGHVYVRRGESIVDGQPVIVDENIVEATDENGQGNGPVAH